MVQEKLDFIEEIIISDAKNIKIDEEFKKNLKNRIISANNKSSVTETYTSPKVISIWDRMKHKITGEKEAKYLKIASVIVSFFIVGNVASLFNNTGLQGLFAKNKDRENTNVDIVNSQVGSKFNTGEKNIAMSYDNSKNNKKENNLNSTKDEGTKNEIKPIGEQKERAISPEGKNDTKISEIQKTESGKNESKDNTDIEVKNENPVIENREKDKTPIESQMAAGNTFVNEIVDLNKKYASNGKTVIKELKIKSIKFQVENAAIPNSKEEKTAVEGTSKKETQKTTINKDTINANISENNNDVGNNIKALNENNNETVENEKSKIEDITNENAEKNNSTSKEVSSKVILVRNFNELFLFDSNKNIKYILKKSINLSCKDNKDILKNSQQIDLENKQLETDFEKLFGEKTVYSFITIEGEKEVYLTVINGETKKEETVRLDTETVESGGNTENLTNKAKDEGK